VFAHDDKYYLFYTGRNRAEYWQQEIGIAVSHNLSVWSKVAENPILSADGTIYCSNWDRDERKIPPAFRDPFIFFDRDSGDFLMLFCARAKGEDVLFNGCIGLARSKDLVNWTMSEPILSPGRYAEMEVPQLLNHEGRWYLFFSTKPENYSPEWAAEVGTHNGLHVYSATTLSGVYEPVGPSGNVQFAEESVYNARVMKEGDGELTALGWVEYGYHGWFQGSLSQRYRLSLTPSASKVQPL
jgi:beta-fructofuranosidase